MDEESDYLIDEYVRKNKEEGLGFHEIRKELESKNFDPDTIKYLIRSINNKILNEEINKSFRIKSYEIFFIGLFLIALGIFLTLSTFIGIIKMKDQFILFYGLILGGLAAILYSRLKKYKTGRKYYKSSRTFLGKSFFHIDQDD